MKLLFFDDFRLGAVVGDAVVDISDVLRDLRGREPQDVMGGLISNFDRYRSIVADAVTRGSRIPLAQVRIRPPLPRPTTIACMAVNYIEEGRADPAPLNGFLKPGSTVIGPEEVMVLPDVPATVFEGEAELGVVIGKRAQRVSATEAMQYVFGYVNFIDGSARGLPPDKNTFYQMKARDTFAPVGPFLVTKDEVPDPYRLRVQEWSNGVLMQDYRTSDMAHRIAECIEWVTSIHALEPGDVLATGTHHGGLFPYQDGDRVEMEVEGLGRLRISVRDDLKRTWGRETRGERQRQGLAPISPQLSGKYAKRSEIPA